MKLHILSLLLLLDMNTHKLPQLEMKNTDVEPGSR